MLSPYMLWSQATSCLCAVYRYRRFLARGKGEQRYPRGRCACRERSLLSAVGTPLPALRGKISAQPSSRPSECRPVDRRLRLRLAHGHLEDNVYVMQGELACQRPTIRCSMWEARHRQTVEG
jgi:hypothetical protein